MTKIIIVISFLFFLTGCSGNKNSEQSPTPIIQKDQPINCPPKFVWDEDSKSCIKNCEEGKVYNPIFKECVSCQGDLVYEKDSKSCICPGKSKKAGEHNCSCEEIGGIFDPELADCKCAYDKIFNEELKQCIPICDSSKGFFYSDEAGGCIKKCPNGNDGFYYDIKVGDCIKRCTPGFKYDKQEKNCIADCKGNSYLNKLNKRECIKGKQLMCNSIAYSILPSFNTITEESERAAICLYIGPSNDNDEKEELRIIDAIKKAVKLWIEPLKNLSQVFISDIEVFKGSPYCENYNRNFISIDIVNNIGCGTTAAGCAYPSQRMLQIKPKEALSIYIHEFGHLFGFDDHYYVEKPSLGCFEGYDSSTTVMCMDDIFLKVADKEAMSKLYCHYYPQDMSCVNISPY
ncbi:MAG: hypothetical protein HQK52_16325 [Oligoflexia bacterium]|nr:hypothetical protein [Oligoflexia bacterium]